jgi:hypothetical protein
VETAEATSLKEPTPVKDHNTSDMAEHDQHKTLKKASKSRQHENLKSFLETYDCKPEKFPIVLIQVSGLRH